MLAAVLSLSMYSCKTDTNPAPKTTADETTTGTEVVAVQEAPKPTGDVEKDAQAFTDYIVKNIEETDFANKDSQKKLEETMNSLEQEFETYYKDKGDDALKAFDEASKKAAEKVNLEDLLSKKVLEAISSAAAGSAQ